MPVALLRDDLVYVLEIEGSSRVKIGHSLDVAKRIRSLQTGSPVPLGLLGTLPGGEPLERWLHKQYAAYRAPGSEWFDLGPEPWATVCATALRRPVPVVEAMEDVVSHVSTAGQAWAMRVNAALGND